MKMSKPPLLAAVAVLAIFAGRTVSAQATGTTVHGHIDNALGQPLTSGVVKFTTERTTPTADLKFPANMVFPIDANGNYTATGLPSGEYYVFVVQGTAIIDRVDLTIKAGATDQVLNDDMTRPEFIASMTPEQRKTLEEYKAKNAAAMADNNVIANLNKTLQRVQADLAAASASKGDVSADVIDMKAAVDAKNNEPVLWTNYGNAELAQGDHLVKADKAAAKPSQTDPDVLTAYGNAIDAYKKGIDLDAASKKPNPAQEAAAYNQMGNAYAHEGKGDEASAAFENAVKLAPANAALYYKNEAVVLLNANQFDQAAAAADKAIAADPRPPTLTTSRARPWWSRPRPTPRPARCCRRRVASTPTRCSCSWRRTIPRPPKPR
jgi:hypothetical protein